MNVINYITITCNLKNVRLQITFDYMKNVIDYNRLRLPHVCKEARHKIVTIGYITAVNTSVFLSGSIRLLSSMVGRVLVSVVSFCSWKRCPMDIGSLGLVEALSASCEPESGFWICHCIQDGPLFLGSLLLSFTSTSQVSLLAYLRIIRIGLLSSVSNQVLVSVVSFCCIMGALRNPSWMVGALWVWGVTQSLVTPGNAAPWISEA
jgi:hypothetical protein